MRPHTRASRLSAMLSEGNALHLMRAGSWLIKMIGHSGPVWFVVPGGQVTGLVADRIKRHPAVISQKDRLYPHHDQTWRMRSFTPTE